MSEKVYMVSVVRDYAMYRKCIVDNPFCRSLSIVTLDNRKENLGIPVRYNRFMDSIQEDGWVVFCHEDWMPLQDIGPLLEGLDRSSIYGPVGAVMEVCPRADFIHISGHIEQRRKDGSWHKDVRGTWRGGDADTFDCQCVIAHSSLLREKDLRFDEHLSFDMYAEDFCASAWLKGVPSKILPVKCRHYSGGTVGQRFWDSLEYLRGKFRDCPKRFPSPVHRRISFGGDQSRPIYNYRRSPNAVIRYLLKK